LDSRLRGNLLDCGARVVPGDCHGAFGASQRQLNTTERTLRATRKATRWWVSLRCTHPTRRAGSHLPLSQRGIEGDFIGQGLCPLPTPRGWRSTCLW